MLLFSLQYISHTPWSASHQTNFGQFCCRASSFIPHVPSSTSTSIQTFWDKNFQSSPPSQPYNQKSDKYYQSHKRKNKSTENSDNSTSPSEIDYIYSNFCVSLSNRRFADAADFLQRLAEDSNPPQITYAEAHDVVVGAMEYGYWSSSLRSLRAMLKLVRHVRKSTVAQVMKGLIRSQRMEECLKVLRWMWKARAVAIQRGEQWPVKCCPDEKMCALAAKAAIECQRLDVAQQIVIEMEKEGIVPSVYTYSIMIKGYGRANQDKSLEQILQLIEQKNVIPDVVLLNTIIGAYMDCNKVSRAFQLLDEYSARFKIEPNVRTYGVLIKGVLQNKNSLHKAFKILKAMEEQGIPQNNILRNKMIDACARCQQWNKALELLDIKLKLDTDKDDMIVTYSSLAGAAIQQGRLKDAQNYIDEMISKGVEPNDITYSALLHYYLRGPKIEDALDFFSSVKQRLGNKISGIAYHIMIAGLARLNDERALKYAENLIDEMRERKINVPIKSYNALMYGYVKRNNLKAAEYVFVRIKDDRLPPTLESYTTIMIGYGKMQRMNQVRSVFKEMKNKGIVPDRMALNAFISCCIRSGELTLAEKIFAQMKESVEVQPNDRTYTLFIYEFMRRQDGETAWSYFAEMLQKNVTPPLSLAENLLEQGVNTNGFLTPGRMIQIFRVLKAAGATEGTLKKWEKSIELLLATIGEVAATDWKEIPANDPTDEIFKRHRWNQFDSSFRAIF